MPYKEDDRWRGVVKIRGKRVATRRFQYKRDAARWERKTRKMFQTEGSTDMAYLSACNDYLDYAKINYTHKTYQEKASVAKKLAAYIKANPDIKNITPLQINRYLMAQAKERSPNAANKDRKNLSAMFGWWSKMYGRFPSPVQTDKFTHDRKPQYTPPTEDVLRVLSVADRKDRVFLDCYLHTGARRSEIFRLTWDDVNFERKELRLGTRKTKTGSMEYEWIPMNATLIDALKWQWKNRFKASPFVFVSTQPGPNCGKPFKVRRRFLKGLCKRAGVKPYGFHALRRYVASVLADNHKVSAKTIQRILRHKSVHTTERYIQNINRDLTSTMALLETPVHTNGTHNEQEVSSDDR